MSRSACLTFLPAVVAIVLSGCSLVTVKTGIVPLTDKEIETRVVTRDYALRFAQTVNVAAIEIDARSDVAAVELDALRWRLGAISSSRQAAVQTAPSLALLDTWALAEQQKQYFGPGGEGEALFGDQHHLATEAAESLVAQIELIARSLLERDDYTHYSEVVRAYAAENPIRSLRFDRSSVLATWTEMSPNEKSLVTAVGTSPQVVNDLTDRFRIFGEELPDQVAVRTRLQMREAGLEPRDLKESVERLKNDLDRLAAVAETSPELVRQAVAGLREEFDPTLDQLQSRMVEAMNRLSQERAAMAKDLDALRVGLAESVAHEREEISVVVASERAAMMSDARVIANDVTERSWKQLRAMVREVGFILIVLAIVVLGLPFAGGYLLGKSVASRRTSNA